MIPRIRRSLAGALLPALALLALVRPASAGDAPAIDAVRAARIATEYLASVGPGAPYIASLTLEKAAILSGKRSWVVRWSRPILADGDTELGLRVNLDGTTARLVEDKSSKARGASGPGSRR